MPCAERVEIDAHRGDVLGQVVRRLLKSDEHAGFIAVARAMDEELEREQCLAAAGAATEQGRAALRIASAGDLVEARYAGSDFGQWRGSW